MKSRKDIKRLNAIENQLKTLNRQLKSKLKLSSDHKAMKEVEAMLQRADALRQLSEDDKEQRLLLKKQTRIFKQEAAIVLAKKAAELSAIVVSESPSATETQVAATSTKPVSTPPPSITNAEESSFGKMIGSKSFLIAFGVIGLLSVAATVAVPFLFPVAAAWFVAASALVKVGLITGAIVAANALAISAGVITHKIATFFSTKEPAALLVIEKVQEAALAAPVANIEFEIIVPTPEITLDSALIAKIIDIPVLEPSLGFNLCTTEVPVVSDAVAAAPEVSVVSAVAPTEELLSESEDEYSMTESDTESSSNASEAAPIAAEEEQTPPIAQISAEEAKDKTDEAQVEIAAESVPVSESTVAAAEGKVTPAEANKVFHLRSPVTRPSITQFTFLNPQRDANRYVARVINEQFWKNTPTNPQG